VYSRKTYDEVRSLLVGLEVLAFCDQPFEVVLEMRNKRLHLGPYFEVSGEFRTRFHKDRGLLIRLCEMLGIAKEGHPMVTFMGLDVPNRTTEILWHDDFSLTGMRFIAAHGKLRAIPLSAAHGKSMGMLFTRRKDRAEEERLNAEEQRRKVLKLTLLDLIGTSSYDNFPTVRRILLKICHGLFSSATGDWVYVEAASGETISIHDRRTVDFWKVEQATESECASAPEATKYVFYALQLAGMKPRPLRIQRPKQPHADSVLEFGFELDFT